MRVLITGALGQLGSKLTDLLEGDTDLFGCDLAPVPPGLPYSYRKCNLTQKAQVKTLMAWAKPDILIHCAAMTQVDLCEEKPKEAWEANSLATRLLAEEAKKWNATVLYISTDYVFNGNKKTPYRPQDKVTPVSVYGRSKAEGESWVQRLVPNWIILRTSGVYGGPVSFVESIIRKAEKEKVLKVVNDQVGAPTYSKDLAETILFMVKKIPSLPKIPTGIYHYSGLGKISWNQFAKEIIRQAGLECRVTSISTKKLALPAHRPANSCLDMGSLKRCWNISPKPWKESLRRYLREKGALVQ
jgi:dTDP-4-dehydrorhamnose reductase